MWKSSICFFKLENQAGILKKIKMNALINKPEYRWVLLPKNPYVMKFAVDDTSYCVLASNLSCIYGEHLKEKDVMKRFHDLNPFADMKSDLIFQSINSKLYEFVDKESNHSLELKENSLVLTLNISTKLFECKYEIRMTLWPAEHIINHVVCPTIIGAMLAENKIKELEKVIPNADCLSASSSTLVNTNISDSTINTKEVSSITNLSTKCDVDTLLNQKVSTELVLSSFARLQSFFNRLAMEQKNVFESLKKDDIPDESKDSLKQVYVEKHNVLMGKPIEFEDVSDAVQVECNVKRVSDKPGPNTVKKSKKIKF